jgi:hypothetical protein
MVRCLHTVCLPWCMRLNLRLTSAVHRGAVVGLCHV